MAEDKEMEREAERGGETNTVSKHNSGETEKGAPPEDLVERKTASSDVVKGKEEQRSAQTCRVYTRYHPHLITDKSGPSPMVPLPLGET